MAGGRHKTGHYTGCFVGRNAGAPTLLIVMTGLRDFFLLDFQLKSQLIVMTGLPTQISAYCNDWTSGLPDFWTSNILPDFWTSNILPDFRTSNKLLDS